MFDLGIQNFLEFIAETDFRCASRLPEELKLSSSGQIETFYAPFEYVNPEARIVICGITPGLQQALIALQVAGETIRAGESVDAALLAAKQTASFAGSMRSNLIRMLDFVGINVHLGIESCSDLFGSHRHLLHTTSALRYPVFKSGKNYSGAPSMLRHSDLRAQVDLLLAKDLAAMPRETILVPLGDKVTEALEYVAAKGTIDERRILSGLPHPSGANAERIKFFLGEKPLDQLSSKTNGQVIATARSTLFRRLEAF
ncbi:hypothetical protein [Motiliproteus sp. SC1-56]|uniref:hypothetical protein n=1 Tax=Motiliproteus sp. SC1-56 TaxID=2799565 RepID=UPI001A8C9F92|nr:hypothetical protein [Motiliproteus sp. SC1-56]